MLNSRKYYLFTAHGWITKSLFVTNLLNDVSRGTSLSVHITGGSKKNTESSHWYLAS
jgi:hypothetical protein